jgi:hypothetical protein
VLWDEHGRRDQTLEVVQYLTDPAKLDLALNPGAGATTGTGGSTGSGSGANQGPSLNSLSKMIGGGR